MRTSILLVSVIASLAIATPMFSGPNAAAHLPASIPAPATSSMLLGLLGLAGLALAGSRSPERRMAPRRVLLAAIASLLPGTAGATPILSEVFFNPSGADDGLEWVEIYNDGASTIDLSGYSLGWGGADYTNGTLQLSGTVAPGSYFVVGGPTSSAANGSPSFDQVANFGPDLENSGWFQPADGVALFDTQAALLTATTVPIDSFIYAGAIASTNSNGLLDEMGSPGAIDFVQPFFGSGYSVEFDGASWSRQNAPTPNAGPLSVPEPSTALMLALGLLAAGSAARRVR